MEIGRRIGNHLGAPLDYETPEVRMLHTAGLLRVAEIIPTGAWAGTILAYINNKKRGAFAQDPFVVPVPSGERAYWEMHLASYTNADEDASAFNRSIPADRVRLDFTRAHTDQRDFRVYYTAGLTAVPDRAVATLGLTDRWTGTETAAQFRYVTDVVAAGGHSWQVRPRDRAGNEKTGCAHLTASLTPWPQPPTGVAVHAYVAASGLVTLKWAGASDETTGSKYYIYRSPTAAFPIRYGTAVASAPYPYTTAGSKRTATFALPYTGAAAAGRWRAGVRHEKGGITEDNVSASTTWVIGEGGDYAAGYPRAPSYLEAKALAAGRIRLRFKHDNRNEPAAAIRFNIYRGRGATPGTVDYTQTAGVVVRGAAELYEGSASLMGLTEGAVFAFGIRSVATGAVTESNTGTVATATPDATPPTSCPASQTITEVYG